MRLDEFGRIEPAARVCAVTRADERGEEFAHFKMEMGKIAAVRCPDSRDLLAAFHEAAGMNEHVLHMPVIRLHIFPFAVFEIRMEQNDNVAPARATVAREQHASVSDRVDRIAEIAVFAANSVQVIAEMMVLGE